MSRNKVLVIDDERLLTKSTCMALNHYGFEASGALDGESGIESVESFRPDIILLDIMMPGLNGIETLSKIREVDKVAVVVMVTALHDITMARDAIEIGASDYITKPIDLKYLLDYISRVSKEMVG